MGAFILILVMLQMGPDSHYSGTHEPTSGKTATIVLIDGLSKEIFQKELECGHLPHLKDLMSRSTFIENGIGSFPSMTGYAFYPFITGMDAVMSDIFGLRWFDRRRDIGNLRNYVGRTNIHMNGDIKNDYLTLFEIFDDQYTASINTYLNRGVHHELKTGWAHTTAKYNQNSIFPLLRAIPGVGKDMIKDHYQHETLVTDLAISQLIRNPKVQWITYPSLDAYNHVHGTDEDYYLLLRHIDKEIGRLVQAIEELGQKERMLAIVSDHGISDVDKNLDIPGILWDSLKLVIERGKSTHLKEDQLSTPMDEFVNKDGYFVINGNLSAYLHLRDQNKSGKDAWRKKMYGKEISEYQMNDKTIDLPIFISLIKGIDITAYAATDSSIVIVKDGMKAEVYQQNERYKYKIITGDPLSMSSYLEIDSFYFENEILQLTKDADYPYALVRLTRLLLHPQSGDMVITTLPGYDVARDYEIFVSNYKGGHGGIRKELLNVPYILFFPEQSSQVIDVVRAEDVGATILQYLGGKTAYQLSGKPIGYREYSK